ncbi:prephenate/arogenate dehydrogenase family protein [Robiginitomaculum antarcticum]|uniref:prephenate/arogenate dehydrogenase family protein n=1 Tax=Robiginitomaculum antarcticum TaxID=437507 RepID=UPI00037D0CC1|nr:prephenate/arogenate dehydrogenase family protein [Robiginitomaculum antarcticum]
MSGFDTILIVGGGLIGSSIARAARRYAQVNTVLMADSHAAVVAQIKALDIADRVSVNVAKLAMDADLVILAVPPGRMGAAAAAVIPAMKSGAVLSDVGSVKGAVIAAVKPHLRDDIVYVPGHPIAGTENSGPEAGFAELFKNRWCILTPDNENTDAAKSLTAFWEGLGSQVAMMSAKRHDTVLATTSHVPHLLAYALVGTAVDMERVTDNEVVKFSAGGFRDFTRIAASDPEMWRDVFLSNKTAVLEVVDRYIEDLSALKRAIRWGEGEALLREFSKTRNIRRQIIDAGQDTSAANFGRDDSNDINAGD